MSARLLSVVVVNRNCAYVSGHGSRELITQLRGRPPIWSSVGRAWVVQPTTARDVVAAAEHRGWNVVISNDDPLPATRGVLF